MVRSTSTLMLQTYTDRTHRYANNIHGPRDNSNNKVRKIQQERTRGGVNERPMNERGLSPQRKER